MNLHHVVTLSLAFSASLLLHPFTSLAEGQEQTRASLSPSPSGPAQANAQSTESIGTVLDMVLASVDGEPVTLSDLRRYIVSQGGVPPQDVQSGDFEVRKQLRELVIENLLRKEAQAAGIVVEKDEIEAYIREIKKQNGVDEDGFQAILASKGLTRDEYVTQVTSDITRARILSNKVRSKINILDEDIKRYLDDHPEMVPEKGSVHLKQISLRDDNPAYASDEDRRAKILQMREQLVAGGSWSEVGDKDFQDLGYVKISELREDLQGAVAKLNINEISPIIKTASGYQLLLMDARNDGEDIDSAVKSRVQDVLFQSRYKEEVDKFLNDELPKKYHVELKL